MAEADNGQAGPPGGPRGAPDEQALTLATALLHDSASLVLASTDAGGEPLASYAPHVVRNRALHIYVSDLAAHSANLALARAVSVMVIEDEARARQAFARLRLVLRCAVAPQARKGPDVEAALDALQERFGAVVGTLRQLADFRLYRLAPVEGQFVQGFGRAFHLQDGDLRRILDGARHAD